MFFLDVETKGDAATCAALMAKGYKPVEVSRLLVEGKTHTRVGFPDSAAKAAEAAQDSPEFNGAAYALHIVEEAQKMTPHIFKTLPNGNALIISADLPVDKVRDIFNKALKV